MKQTTTWNGVSSLSTISFASRKHPESFVELVSFPSGDYSHSSQWDTFHSLCKEGIFISNQTSPQRRMHLVWILSY